MNAKLTNVDGNRVELWMCKHKNKDNLKLKDYVYFTSKATKRGCDLIPLITFKVI